MKVRIKKIPVLKTAHVLTGISVFITLPLAVLGLLGLGNGLIITPVIFALYTFTYTILFCLIYNHFAPKVDYLELDLEVLES